MKNDSDIFEYSKYRRSVVSRHFLNVLSTVLYQNRVGILLNGLAFFLLWIEPQGKDLVLSLNQDGRTPVFLFYALLFLLAAIIWYTPRFIYKDNFTPGSIMSLFRDDNHSYYQDNKDSLEGHLRRMVPRILGTSLLLIGAFSFLNILIEYSYNVQTMRWPFTGIRIGKASHPFILSLLILISLISPKMYEFFKKYLLKFKVSVILVLTALFVLQLLLIWSNTTAYNNVQEVFWIGLILSFFFAGFVLARKSIYLLRRITGPMILISLGVLILLGILAFALANIVLISRNLLWEIQIFHPLIVLFSGLVFYVFLTMMLIFIGKATRFKIKGRILKFHYLSMVLIIALVLGQINKNDGHFNITTIEHSTIHPDQRPQLTEYFDGWYEHRREFIQQFIRKSGRKYPILIVSAEGGGSRAALWTLMVNSYLQKNNPDYFNNHLFSFTNASGGGTGNGMFLCLMANETDVNEIFNKCGEVFTKDYLSSSIALLLGFDGFQSITGLNIMNDRAAVLENEWQKGISIVDNDVDFKKPFLAYWNNNGTINVGLPLLFLNTTNVQTGNHAITSPVQINQKFFPNSTDMLVMVDSLTGRTINLATATLLNARFPFVNPVGTIEGANYQFGDAGYYDNYGAENAANIIRSLKAHLFLTHPQILDSLEFVSVVIENSSVEKDNKPEVKPQFYAPVNALVKIRSANTRYALEDLQRVADVFYKFSLKLVEIPVDESGEKTVIPGIPLARHLSKTAVRAIRQSCLDQNTGTYPKFQRLLDRLDSDL